ncbi:fluoride efflux transporter CrcB [Ferrimonas gelatinilytica]|uniref:Fluoride-specific ion channel FluC n=1 Tax=Ferrimonas gelatinilytica TaxID=1255257 RepID=A0ABP9RXK5_9GAMM
MAVALGGALGATLRYGTSLLMLRLVGTSFPLATLLVNALGSLAMGALYALSMQVALSPTLKAFIGVGLLGALTTFSTFSNETVLLMQQGHGLRALLNVVLNLGVCFTMVYIGQQWVATQQ